MLNIDFALDGVSAKSKGIILQKNITFSSAEPKVETVSIPGRNGDLHIYDGSYSNVTGKAECYAASASGGVSAAIKTINQWLSGSFGYRKLTYSYEPGFYRKARVKGSAEYDARLNVIAPFNITFDCQPQIFYESGDTAITITKSGTEISNIYGFVTKPLIKITGSGAVTLNIAGTIMQISSITDYIMIDCESEDAYKGDDNLNTMISGDFPELAPGANAVTWSGSGTVTSIEITPRWWTL